ncbi:protein WEAK CHLOROPLAST MOVEMENT UNDER BLUE LIGHT 1-like [Typha latifolia]|uniref:protein WEAK CHLOROPLAST MOVEMENT UNDER BLUE LIGHT 1-like n=1 Tax=Typha latifolia TaxID=4733 RepID=UPI003C2BC902
MSTSEIPPTPVEPPMSTVTEENVDTNQQQGPSVNYETPIHQHGPDGLLLDHNEPDTLISSNESRTSTDDTVPSSSEVLSNAAPHSLDKVMEDMETESMHKLEDGSSDSVSDAQISNGHAAPSQIGKATEEPHDAPVIKESTPSSEMNTKQDRSQVMPDEPDRTKVENVSKRSPADNVKNIQSNRSLIDTAAPFESVKEAVTKFGGIVDWKAHKAQALERSKHIRFELEKVQKEIPECKKQSEAAEEAKAQVLEELESTKRLVEELKLNLERAQTEEAQAKQDSELAQLRVKEMEQGIADEASVAAKAQVEVAKARHAAAVAELKSVKEELKALQEEYASLVNKRDMSIKKAEEAVSASKEIEKTVEELTLELITTKESLELAHAAHLEAEEHRIGAALAREQDCLTWEKELKQTEEELQRLNDQLLSAKDLKSKLSTASTSLLNLNAELAAYMEAKVNQEAEGTEEENGADELKKTQKSIQEALVSTSKELEEVKKNIEKTKDEVNILRVAASALKSELDREKTTLSTLQQREGMASIAVSSLEAELNKTKEELEAIRKKEKETREKMVELPKVLQQAAQEADEAKSAAQMAQEELRRAKEEAEQAKASTSTTEIRLHAALKEIEATRASEKLALAAVKALQESEQAGSIEEDSPRGITLPVDEYFALSKSAHEAEELAHVRVTAAFVQVELAKDSESKSLERLNEAYKEMDERKRALRVAIEKSERAKEGKLGVEQELRKWRADNEKRRKAGDAAKAAVNPSRSPPGSFEHRIETKGFDKEEGDVYVHPMSDPKLYTAVSSPDEFVSDTKVRKKKSLLPRIVMFLARKKGQPQ